MESMTGFAEVSESSDVYSIKITLKSVNGKYLNPVVKCNIQSARIEEEAYRSLKNLFSRGSITAVISVRTDPFEQIDLSGLAAKIKDIPEELTPVSAELGSILRAAVYTQSQEDVPQPVIESCTSLFTQAVSQLKSARKAEGSELGKDLTGIISNISDALLTVKNRIPELQKTIKKQFIEAINEIADLTDSELNENDLAREIALRCEKANINEEVERAMIHIETFRKAIASDTDSMGKKLDFLCQELHREINTLGVKIKDSDLISLIVDLKTDIDRLKEQVQNVQ